MKANFILQLALESPALEKSTNLSGNHFDPAHPYASTNFQGHGQESVQWSMTYASNPQSLWRLVSARLPLWNKTSPCGSSQMVPTLKESILPVPFARERDTECPGSAAADLC